MIALVQALWAPFVVGAAAVAAERARRSRGRPGRWPWAAALPLSLVLIGLGLSGRAVVPLRVLPAGASVASAEPAGAGVLAWAALTALLLLLLVCDIVRLRARARGWLPARVAGVPVRVTSSTGPATLGIVRPRIVLPHWVLALRPHDRRLVVLHELEHARARDVALMAGAALLLVLVPWHPALWWQAARLHRALELDCDARVARRTRDVRAYARLLLHAGERARRPPLLAAALGRRRPLLERRLAALIRPPARRGGWVAAAGSVALLGLACIAPAPTAPIISERAQSTLRAVEAPRGFVRRATPTEAGRYRFDGGADPGTARVAPAGNVMRLREQPPRD